MKLDPWVSNRKRFLNTISRCVHACSHGDQMGAVLVVLLLRHTPISMCSDAGVSRAHGPPATKFPECKMGTQKLWPKGVETFMDELDPATAANRWDLHDICIFSGCVRDKHFSLKRCDCARAGTKWSIPTCPACPPLLLAIFPPLLSLVSPQAVCFCLQKEAWNIAKGVQAAVPAALPLMARMQT